MCFCSYYICSSPSRCRLCVCVCVNMLLLLAAPPHPMKAKSEECESLYGLIWVNGSDLTMQIAGLVQDSILKVSKSDLHLASWIIATKPSCRGWIVTYESLGKEWIVFSSMGGAGRCECRGGHIYISTIYMYTKIYTYTLYILRNEIYIIFVCTCVVHMGTSLWDLFSLVVIIPVEIWILGRGTSQDIHVTTLRIRHPMAMKYHEIVFGHGA